jgi:hypothetical protein
VYDADVYLNEILEELGHIYSTSVRAEDILEDLKQNIDFDPEEIYNMIDDFHIGHMSSNVLQRFLL